MTRPVSSFTADERAVIKQRHFGWERARPQLLADVFGTTRQAIVAILYSPEFAHGSHHGQEPVGAGFQPIPPFDAPAGSDPFATAQHADCANRNDRADSTDLTMSPCAKTAQEELSCKR